MSILILVVEKEILRRKEMIDFEKEIKNVAKERIKLAAEEKESKPEADMGKEIKEVMNKLFNIAELGITIYNEGLDKGKLSIYKLPEQLLALFLNLPGKRLGFCLIAEEKFVVFLDEEPNQVVVVGKNRQSFGTGENVLTKARQLIRITFMKSDNGFVFKDNTGSILDPEEIALHIIKWAVSN